ncbi:Cyclic AMP receptor 2 [Fusarium austroafricanum]|uniref:Cyclic AMP receptor 2 n=1 Tax=Fusarium austroafricanum TaxID=2364996 RepID=A0A8H4KIP7_9HYPO|nr:Cyclic AMP receptor 2 [Fusarium austroafricanum]
MSLTFSTHNTNTLFSKGSKDVGFQIMKEDNVELGVFKSRHGNIDPHLSTMFEARNDWAATGGDKMDEIEDMESRGESEASNSRTRGRSIRHRPSSQRGSELAYSGLANTEPVEAPPSSPQIDTLQTNASEFPQRRGTQDVEAEIKRMMLLNGYPIMYVLLWIPGLTNRLLEAMGPVSETTSAALNASTQFIGFANAATYGFNHHLRDRLDALYWTPTMMKMKKRFRR